MRFGGNARSFAVLAADLDSDGRLDIVVGNAGEPNVAYVQRADGRLQARTFGSPAGVTYGLVAADWDGDGRPEIATANSDGPNFLYAWQTPR